MLADSQAMSGATIKRLQACGRTGDATGLGNGGEGAQAAKVHALYDNEIA